MSKIYHDESADYCRHALNGPSETKASEGDEILARLRGLESLSGVVAATTAECAYRFGGYSEMGQTADAEKPIADNLVAKVMAAIAEIEGNLRRAQLAADDLQSKL